MTKITGYARKKEPKWLYWIAAAAAFAVVGSGIFGVYLISRWVEDIGVTKHEMVEIKLPTVSTLPVAEIKTLPKMTSLSGDVQVERIVFTSEINDKNQPTDDLENISIAENGVIYCYTRINASSPPQVIRHVWVAPDGRVAAEIKLNLSNRTTDTWSYISLYGTRPGKWELQVKDSKDQILAKRGFSAF